MIFIVDTQSQSGQSQAVYLPQLNKKSWCPQCRSSFRFSDESDLQHFFRYLDHVSKDGLDESPMRFRIRNRRNSEKR